LIDCKTYFDKYKILSPNQFGFKEKSSTLDAVRELFDKMAENTDNKKAQRVQCF